MSPETTPRLFRKLPRSPRLPPDIGIASAATATMILRIVSPLFGSTICGVESRVTVTRGC